MADRRYSDKEVGQILKMAAKVQSGGTSSGSAEGMTLAELQKVADEVGIDAAVIGAAAAELDTASYGKSYGRSNSVLLERTIEGQLSEEGWDQLVTELRRFSGKSGKFVDSGNTREWLSGQSAGSIMLSATVRGDRTHLKLLGDSTDAKDMAGGVGFVAVALLSLMPIVVNVKLNLALHPLMVLAASAAIALICVAIASGFLRSYRKRFAGEMEGLLGKLGQTAQRSVGGESSVLRSQLSAGGGVEEVGSPLSQEVVVGQANVAE